MICGTNCELDVALIESKTICFWTVAVMGRNQLMLGVKTSSIVGQINVHTVFTVYSCCFLWTFLENRLDFIIPSWVDELAVIVTVISSLWPLVHVINALQITFLTKIFILMRKLSFSHFIWSCSQEIWQCRQQPTFYLSKLDLGGHTFVVEIMRIGASCESKDYMIEINNPLGRFRTRNCGFYGKYFQSRTKWNIMKIMGGNTKDL